MARALYARQLGGGNSPEHIFYRTSIARARGNRDANRYSNVLPYDRTLVGAGDGGEYINASVVVSAGMWWVAAQVSSPNVPFSRRDGSDRYAAEISVLPAVSARSHQAPLPDNFAAFFRTILRRRASASPLVSNLATPSKHAILVQLTGWTESGKPKADPYMPYVFLLPSHHSTLPAGTIPTHARSSRPPATCS